VTDGVPSAAELARAGFADGSQAHRLLLAATHDDAPLPREMVAALAAAADPDSALLGLVRLLEASAPSRGLRAALSHDELLRKRLGDVLGNSLALADHLVRHVDDWQVLADPLLVSSRPSARGLRATMLDAVGADPTADQPISLVDESQGMSALRRTYRRELLSVAARDLTHGLSVDDVAAELADLAGATLEAALAVARRTLPTDSQPTRLAVIGMGKLGGRELNYVSDVDVVYVAQPVAGEAEDGALQSATRLAATLARLCSTVTDEGSLWEVDAGLRPEGRAGPLVRTLASHVAYYDKWAKTWEFQALLKARPVAGDLELAQQYVEAVSARAWAAADHPGFVEDVQQMRRRVEETVSRGGDRELKLRPGGLRDVEFSVQLLQLVHGRSDASLRSPTTLSALHALAAGGYVGRDDARALDDAYRFLRTLEHRVQLYRLQRTHVVPDNAREVRRIARSMGLRSNPQAELEASWRAHSRTVRRLHEKLFYRPLLIAVARLEPSEARLTPEAASERLVALGYADPAGALRHLTALTSGVTRRAAIQRTLLPVMLGWFADAPDPDAGLLAFRQVSDALGTTHWYLALLRDAGAAAERLARVLASSRYATDLLQRAPEAVAMLGDDDELRPRTLDQLRQEILATVSRSASAADGAISVRAIRRRELFRIAAADVLGLLDVVAVGIALSELSDACLTGAVTTAVRSVEKLHGAPLPTAFAVIGMGRLGGNEQSYASDADVLFVHDPLPGAEEKDAADAAHAIANELRALLARPAPDPPLLVDADLRPEGRQGPLVRTLASYQAYYARWSAGWEAQALLRARFIAGDAALGERFMAMADQVRWPEGGLAQEDVREIRRIKARVEAERLPRGADPATHLKLGPGGLADVEWTVQLLQLEHAAAEASLRTTQTLVALQAAADASLLAPRDAEELATAWRLASQIRNAITLVRGRPDDQLPHDLRDADGVARLVGYPPGETQRLLEDYRRNARRARAVVDKVFYR